MLYVTTTEHGLQVLLDDAGIAVLENVLARLRAQGHIHIGTPSCGHNELDEVSPYGDKTTIHDISLDYEPDYTA
jgi:hypothetical protein